MVCMVYGAHMVYCVSVHSTVCIGFSDLLDFYVNICLQE